MGGSTDGFTYQSHVKPILFGTGDWWRLCYYSFLASHMSLFLYFSTSLSPFLSKFSAGMGTGIGVVTNLAKIVLVEINVFLQSNSVQFGQDIIP